jgi:hypothetical protein
MVFSSSFLSIIYVQGIVGDMYAEQILPHLDPYQNLSTLAETLSIIYTIYCEPIYMLKKMFYTVLTICMHD